MKALLENMANVRRKKKALNSTCDETSAATLVKRVLDNQANTVLKEDVGLVIRNEVFSAGSVVSAPTVLE